MKIVTYFSENVENPQMNWIGYIQNGGIFLGIRFHGETEKEVKKKARFWHENQTKPKVYQVETTEEEFAAWKETQPEPEPKKVFPSQMVRVSQGPGRGHGNAGRIWVINKKTRERKRVLESELQDYMSQGFIRGKKI